MLRLAVFCLVLALVSCSAVESQECVEVDYFGFAPRTLIHGSVVGPNGDGIGGVAVTARCVEQGEIDSIQHFVATTAKDGSWSWRAPAFTAMYLSFRISEYQTRSQYTAMLRPGRTYDFGRLELDRLCDRPVRIRFLSPGGWNLTRFAFGEMGETGYDFLSRCWEAPFDVFSAELDVDVRVETYDGSLLEILTGPLHSILQVRYPDGTPVVGAEVEGESSSLYTNAAGEVALVSEFFPDMELTVKKGDYSVALRLGDPVDKITRCVMPRGGDVDFELTCEAAVPPPLGWSVARTAGYRRAEEIEGYFTGRLRGVVENLEPGAHSFVPSLWYGLHYAEPSARTVVVRPDEKVNCAFPLEVLPAKEVEVRVVDRGGNPVPDAIVNHGLEQRRTGPDGVAGIRVFERIEEMGERRFDVEHPTIGYSERFEGWDMSHATGDSDGFDIPLDPWSSLEFRVVDRTGAAMSRARLEAYHSSRFRVMHARWFRGEPSWWSVSFEGDGIVQARLRQGEYTVSAAYLGWVRSDTVQLKVGAAEQVVWQAPRLRPVQVRVEEGGDPAGGRVRLQASEFQGWHNTGNWTELDALGRATLHAPGDDSATPIELRWKHKSRERKWTTVEEGRVTLQVTPE